MNGHLSQAMLIAMSLALLALASSNTQRADLVLLQQTFLGMAKKLKTEITRLNREDVPINKRNLVIYHVNEVNHEKDSVDISYNNLQIFISSVNQHTESANQHAFYIFNVVGGTPANLVKYIPAHKRNVAFVEWPKRCSEKDTPLKTVLQLGATFYSNFSSIVVSSDRSRGPMVGVRDAAWIDQFRFLLDDNNVAIVGSSFSCEIFAHVQPHMYMIRTQLLSEAAAKFSVQKKTHNINMMQYFQDGMSVIATRLGFRMASILYYKRGLQLYFDNQCISVTNKAGMVPASSNPTSWCDVTPEELIFVKWGGVPLRAPAITMCTDHIDKVMWVTMQLAVQDPTLQLHIPETFHRNVMYELRKQYNMEYLRSLDVSKLIITNTSSAYTGNSYSGGSGVDKLSVRDSRYGSNSLGTSNSNSFSASTTSTDVKYATALANPRIDQLPYSKKGPKVCLFVHTVPSHDSEPSVRGSTIFTSVDIEGMIHSLLRQSNPNWKAYFLLGPVPNTGASSSSGASATARFEGRVRSVLNKYGDVRLSLLANTAAIGDQTLSSAAQLDRIIKEIEYRTECAYVSLTAADTMYGHEVIQNILYTTGLASPSTDTTTSGGNTHSTSSAGEKKDSSASVSSANTGFSTTGGFEKEDFEHDREAPHVVFVPYDSKINAEHEEVTRNSLRHVAESWLESCINFDAMFAAHMMPYAVQPNVMNGRIDLAAVFLQREQLLKDKVKFGSVPIPESILSDESCTGCDNAVLIQYLVRAKQWFYVRLPMDGMKSVVFRAPSPTLCVASGNVWFDYPDHRKTGCISQEILAKLQSKDNKERPYLDWKFSHSRHKICIRLSESGYAAKDEVFFTRP